MATLAQAFDQFRRNLDLPAGVKQQISQRRAPLISSLQQIFQSPAVRPIGSHARGTDIPPVDDIDLMLVLDRPRTEDPGRLLDDLQSALAREYRVIRRQNRSIGILFDDFRFDIVPARTRSGGGYHIVDSSSGRWIFTNPEKHRAFANRVDQATGAMAVPIVRMLKCWNRNQNVGLKSFHLEVMVLRALGRKPNSYAEGTRDALGRMTRAVASSCGDPAESSHCLDDYLREPGHEWRVREIARQCEEARERLASAIRLAQQGDSAGAVRLARAVFGAPFPG